MTDNPLLPLTFIAGPAILMNACSVMQNGTNLRYNLAVTQLREFRTLIATREKGISDLYSDPVGALKAAKKRIKLLLLGMNLLYAAVGMFGVTAFIGLSGAFLAEYAGPSISKLTITMVVTALLGILFLLSAVITFIAESVCAREMLRLRVDPDHLDFKQTI
ncbi:DUF2721 domain-containing protein [Dyadobacter sp. LJ53]|uniref:DUF2721 domain-containing protein n=1 Tax=Dyadobacter chenwenxiniae TaxID=2906456 RepID=UPI001F32BF23|nr:DUF2721 domain-containing protein [Dyadobacter chenwenxiniae]MCF0051687.1 DUF2721 domain-containing protein [Dyadobacter chenwenxiniae]